MKIENWGIIPFEDAWAKQRELFNHMIKDDSIEERIILVEHKPVYTLGFHGNADNLLISRDSLLKQGINVVRIERGGDITYHGPGQLVVYPILNLKRRKLGVKQYVHLLENAIIKLLSVYGIKSSTDESAIGVWLDIDKPSARKICAIGVKISHGVTMHGLALNVNTDLSAFDMINPCGFKDKGVTSMAKEVGFDLSLKRIKEEFAEILFDSLNK